MCQVKEKKFLFLFEGGLRSSKERLRPGLVTEERGEGKGRCGGREGPSSPSLPSDRLPRPPLPTFHEPDVLIKSVSKYIYI